MDLPNNLLVFVGWLLVFKLLLRPNALAQIKELKLREPDLRSLVRAEI